MPRGQDKARAVRTMFDRIAPRYDLLNRLLTFGMDVGWRRRTVRALGLAPGSRVLDLACGTGDLCRELRARGHRPVGVDFAMEMLRRVRADAPLVQADILALPIRDGVADGITCGFALRNVADLSTCFAEMARVLRPGGRVAILEVSQPANTAAARVHAFYFNRVVPVVGGLLSDRRAYAYLPRSVVYLPPREELLEMLGAAGFTSVRAVEFATGAAQLVLGERP